MKGNNLQIEEMKAEMNLTDRDDGEGGAETERKRESGAEIQVKSE